MNYTSVSRKIFCVCNYILMISLAIICIIPVLNLLAISLSSSDAINLGKVNLIPVEFNFEAYKYVANNKDFWNSVVISLLRTVLGVSVNMILTVLVAYPLSKDKDKFYKRNWYANFFVITMLVGGGLIPVYIIVSATGLLNTIWALILPTAVPVYNVILLQNFFRGIPREIEEATFIDGGSVFTSLFRIYIPLSKPALATVLLFATVGHWNEWFSGLIYMNDKSMYPLQTYLQTIVIDQSLTANKTAKEMEMMLTVSSRNLNAAQIFIAMLPILIFYPFLQKYFTKGIVLGSVKG